MSIGTRVVIPVTLKQVDAAPYAKACAQRNHKCLQYVDTGTEKSHIDIPLPEHAPCSRRFERKRTDAADPFRFCTSALPCSGYPFFETSFELP